VKTIVSLLLGLALCAPAAANNGTATESFCARHGCADVGTCEPTDCPTCPTCPTVICPEVACPREGGDEPTFVRCEAVTCPTPDYVPCRRSGNGKPDKCPRPGSPRRVLKPLPVN